MTKELVVARYSEHVRWTQDAPCEVTVYNKGIDDVPHALLLQNVGREGQTYLAHITLRYNELSDWTVFCQGNAQDHLGEFSVEWLLEAEKRVKFPTACQIVDWDQFGNLVHPAKWGEWYRDGVMKRSGWTMRNWFREFVGCDLPNDGLVYTPGACFGVSKEAIQSHPQEYYERLMNTMSHHVHPEEAYYMERAWLYVFGVA